MSNKTKMGWGKIYESPETNAIELIGGPCMYDASPNGGLQDVIVGNLIDEGV